jgi:hypothetical protein
MAAHPNTSSLGRGKGGQELESQFNGFHWTAFLDGLAFPDVTDVTTL